MMENMPDGDSLESKEEETVRRDACAVGFLGKPSYNSILVNVYVYDCLQRAQIR
jgi:hypothetical protein